MTKKEKLKPVDVSYLLKDKEERQSFVDDSIASGDIEVLARCLIILSEGRPSEIAIFTRAEVVALKKIVAICNDAQVSLNFEPKTEESN